LDEAGRHLPSLGLIITHIFSDTFHIRLLETLIATKYTKNRHRLLEEANLSLEFLRFQMRLAKDLQCLKVESYAFASKAIDEIGRPVGGWLRSRGEENA
jgi:hypothetical protein